MTTFVGSEKPAVQKHFTYDESIALLQQVVFAQRKHGQRRDELVQRWVAIGQRAPLFNEEANEELLVLTGRIQTHVIAAAKRLRLSTLTIELLALMLGTGYLTEVRYRIVVSWERRGHMLPTKSLRKGSSWLGALFVDPVS